MDIIGLGTAACNIVECFTQYPQYSVYKIDSEEQNGNFIYLEKQTTPEDYEKNAPSMSSFLPSLGQEISFFVVGSGFSSAATLALLEQLKGKKITVYYIQPKLSTLSGTRKLLERTVFGILQQYARSGLLEKMVIINNEKIASIVGNLPVIGYFDKINQMICSTIHFINVYSRTKYIYGVSEERQNVCRLETIGLLDTASSQEKLFYEFDLIREKDYLYALKQDELLSESSLIRDIERHMTTKKENNLTKISYRLYSTEYQDNFGFCIFRTSKAQEEI